MKSRACVLSIKVIFPKLVYAENLGSYGCCFYGVFAISLRNTANIVVVVVVVILNE